MSISTERACELLHLPLGAPKDIIELSYKKQALKWHPDKFACKNHHEALKRLQKFKMASVAYRKLVHNGRDDKDMTLYEMFEQYRQVFHPHDATGSNIKKNKPLTDLKVWPDCNNNSNSNDTSNSNSSSSSNSNSNSSTSSNTSQEDDDSEYHDARECASSHQSSAEDNEHENQCSTLKFMVKALAVKGVELAKHEDYVSAIEQFSEAIRFDTNDHRLYGNRSYCYDKINAYEDALNDAQKAICIDPLWPKGYFRKGRALFGLKMYKEAEQAYMKVASTDRANDAELDEELCRVRAMQLQEMGFGRTQCEMAVRRHASVHDSLVALIAAQCTATTIKGSSNRPTSNESSDSVDTHLTESCDEMPDNDELYDDSCSTTSSSNQQYRHVQNNNFNNNSNNKNYSSNSYNNNHDGKLRVSAWGNSSSRLSVDLPDLSSSNNSSNSNNSNSSNSNKSGSEKSDVVPCASLWVGNVDESVSEETLAAMFGACGSLASIRCLPTKKCAFVNYKRIEDAQLAMHALQGRILRNQKLLIKYPDNPNTPLFSPLSTKSAPKVPTTESFASSPLLTTFAAAASALPLRSSAQKSAGGSSNSSDASEIESRKIKKKSVSDESDQWTLATTGRRRQPATTTTTTTSTATETPLAKKIATKTAASSNSNVSSDAAIKQNGPVNGDECYFWRTTGCIYADKCHFDHIPKNRGIDKKPWHK